MFSQNSKIDTFENSRIAEERGKASQNEGTAKVRSVTLRRKRRRTRIRTRTGTRRRRRRMKRRGRRRRKKTRAKTRARTKIGRAHV